MEIDKELRLPFGCKSWYELLNEVPFQDEIPLWQQKSNVKFFRDYEWGRKDIKPTDAVDYEIFEGDVLTLKVRAFDELRAIIPERKDLIKMIEEVRFLRNHLHLQPPTGDNICNFIEKLINLT